METIPFSAIVQKIVAQIVSAENEEGYFVVFGFAKATRVLIR